MVSGYLHSWQMLASHELLQESLSFTFTALPVELKSVTSQEIKVVL